MRAVWNRWSLLLGLVVASSGCKEAHTLQGFEGSITMRTSTPEGETRDLIVKAKGDMLRFDTKGPGGLPTRAIYDPKTNKVTVVLDAQKEYMDLDFRGPSAPKANTDPGSSTITKAGGHKAVAGYDCAIWSVKDASGRRSDVCMAEGIAFVDLARLAAGSTRPESPLAKEFRENKSFPLESVEYDASDKEMSRMEVVGIVPAKLADTDFRVPDGYLKVDAPGRK